MGGLPEDVKIMKALTKDTVVESLYKLIEDYEVRLDEAREEMESKQADYREAAGRFEEIQSMIIDLKQTVKQL